MQTSPNMKIAVASLGCKLNQAEAELLARQITEAGYTLVAPSDGADLYILNTCTVTHIADRKSRHWLRLAHRHNPGAKLVVTGCYAERAAAELARITGVTMVIGNEQKPRLLRILDESGLLNRVNKKDIARDTRITGRTRAMVKVQEGCTNFCTYCIVPMVRRGERSVPVEQVITEIKELVTRGYQEVVLTGTKVGSYCHDGILLVSLLRRILRETEVKRLRLSSLQPQEISPELIQLWQNPRLCPHFHLSLQSGSDSVLGRMKRRYTTAGYQQVVKFIRAAVPEAAITTDIIVGFPGETEIEFNESYEFCRQMQFARMHIFPYSPREGTAASQMLPVVPEKIKRQRNEKMLALAEESAAAFWRQFAGETMTVLWENCSGDDIWCGFTGNYLKVYLKSKENLANQLLPVKLA